MMMHERGDRVSEVKGSEPSPIALVTTRIGKEVVAAKEIENALFPYVESVNVVPLSRRGIVLVFGNIDSRANVVRLLKARGVSRAFWVIPVDACCRARYECIKRCALELVVAKGRHLPIKIVCKCRKRGLEIDSCSRLCRYVGEFLEALHLVEVCFKCFDYVLRIEVVDSWAYLSLYSRDEEAGFRLRTFSSEL